MLDVGWPELLVIGAVALVAVGPKDLPRVMHALGRWAGRARATMHDFTAVLEQAGREAEAAARKEQEQKAERPSDTTSHREDDRERND